MSTSLWNIPDVENVRTPLSIMKEQANFLTTNTGSLLYGTVEASGHGDYLIIVMKIIVPNLNNYSFTVIQYRQQVMSIYPGNLHSSLQRDNFEIENEEGFVNTLGFILRSNEMSELLTSLMAQAKAR
jgi:hypothetical protein